MLSVGVKERVKEESKGGRIDRVVRLKRGGFGGAEMEGRIGVARVKDARSDHLVSAQRVFQGTPRRKRKNEAHLRGTLN